MEDDKGDKGEVQFNLGSNQLMLIGELLFSASRNYRRGELMRWFFDLKQVKLQIISRLKESEMVGLGNLERLIGVTYLKEGSTKQGHQKLGGLIEQYNIVIMQLLEGKGFLVPSKEDHTLIYDQKGED